MRTEQLIPVRVYRSASEAPAPPAGPAGASLLECVQRRGVLRVGYAPDALPFSFFNGDGELVGFDVERVYGLAGLLDCGRIDFIPVSRQTFASELDDGVVDIAIGAIDVTPTLYKDVDFSSVYLTLHIALVAPDAEVDDYRTAARLGSLQGRRIAVEKGSYYAGAIRAGNPNFTVVEVDSALDFFKGDVADALFTSAEEGSAYTLMYPHYDVVVPEFEQPPLYLAYPVAKDQLDWLALVDNWLVMEKESGAQQTQYDYWITGKTAVEKKPRWSVIRDVLGWVK
jgi:ABC-type amino acid transport substrate-binding protein